jgi:hypothetical protein
VNAEKKPLSQSALARQLGISPAAVTANKIQGMPVSSLAAATAWRRAHLDPAHTKAEPGEKTPAPNPLRRPASTAPPGGSTRPAKSETTTYQNARTAREVLTARLMQIELEQQVGRLVDAAAVRVEFARQVVGVRDRLLRLPDRIVVVIHGESDPRRLRALIDAEVRAALAEFHG